VRVSYGVFVYRWRVWGGTHEISLKGFQVPLTATHGAQRGDDDPLGIAGIIIVYLSFTYTNRMNIGTLPGSEHDLAGNAKLIIPGVGVLDKTCCVCRSSGEAIDEFRPCTAY